MQPSGINTVEPSEEKVRKVITFRKQVFIYSNEEKIARIFLHYFKKIYDMLLRKVQQSYCYTKLCNYREEFLSKPIISQFNIVVS